MRELALRQMKVAKLMRLVLLMAMLPTLAACQRTLLSQAPVEGAGCDAALVGHWLSDGEGSEADGEIEAWLGADCVLKAVEQRSEGPRTWPPIRVSTARFAGRDLLLLDAAAANVAFEVEPGPLDREGAVYVFAYRLRRDGLTLLPPDHRRLAQAVVAGTADGGALVEDSNITVRLDARGEALADLLGARRSFARDEAVVFRRADSR